MIEPVFAYRFGIGWHIPAPTETMASIIAEVAAKYGLTVKDLRGPDQSRRVSKPRQEAMWRMVEAKRWTLNQIGNQLGGRDHSTILHGWRQVEKLRAEAREMARAA